MNTHEHDPGDRAIPSDPIATTLDEDLVLFHYRDGLPQERIEAIAAALHASPELRARYAELCDLLAAAGRVAAPAPAAGLEGRIWERLQPRLDAAAPAAPARRRARPRVAARSARVYRVPQRWAMAAAVVLALALGIAIGGIGMPQRSTTTRAGTEAAPAPGTPATAHARPPAAADDRLAPRMLDAYVAAHLRASQGVLLTMLNSDDDALAASGAELAAALVESNRLYAAAAARAGNARLVALLQQLEPLLIEIANPAPAGDVEVRKGLGEYVRDSDLLFRLRATEARLDPRRDRRA